MNEGVGPSPRIADEIDEHGHLTALRKAFASEEHQRTARKQGHDQFEAPTDHGVTRSFDGRTICEAAK